MSRPLGLVFWGVIFMNILMEGHSDAYAQFRFYRLYCLLIVLSKKLSCYFIFYFILRSSTSSRLQESGYKVLTTWCRVLERDYTECFLLSTPLYLWCGEHRGTLYHIFWTCPRICPYWLDVCTLTEDLTDLSRVHDTCLLHLSPLSKQKYQHSLVRYFLNATRACIPAYWKSPSLPTLHHWIRTVIDIIHMEEPTAS